MKENIHSADLCIVKAFRVLLDKWHLHQRCGLKWARQRSEPTAMGTTMTQCSAEAHHGEG